jgi:hypothetical protein
MEHLSKLSEYVEKSITEDSKISNKHYFRIIGMLAYIWSCHICYMTGIYLWFFVLNIDIIQILLLLDMMMVKGMVSPEF